MVVVVLDDIGLYYDRRKRVYKYYDLNRNKFIGVDEVYRKLRESGFSETLAIALASSTYTAFEKPVFGKKVALNDVLQELVAEARKSAKFLRNIAEENDSVKLSMLAEFMLNSMRIRKRGWGSAQHKRVDVGTLDFYVVRKANIGKKLSGKGVFVIDNNTVLVSAKNMSIVGERNVAKRRIVLGVNSEILSKILNIEIGTDDVRKALKRVAKRSVDVRVFKRSKEKVNIGNVFKYTFNIDFSRAVIVDKKKFECAMTRIAPELNFYGEQSDFLNHFVYRSLLMTEQVGSTKAKELIQKYYLKVWGVFIDKNDIDVTSVSTTDLNESRAKFLFDVHRNVIYRFF